MANTKFNITTAEQARILADNANKERRDKILEEIYEEIEKKASEGEYFCSIPLENLTGIKNVFEKITETLNQAGFSFTYVSEEKSYCVAW